jgi:hypothetical protein
VLAARRLRDLVWVVTAFTVAHTLTLTLSVLDAIPQVPEGGVEPMIAGSIVFVAVQNVFWPKASRGWMRLTVAFAFGLFHGLGYAGGLKEAMGGMSMDALGAGLGGFSVGVEAGHQLVVLPLFAGLYALRHALAGDAPRVELYGWVKRVGSGVISVAGVYYLVGAMR